MSCTFHACRVAAFEGTKRFAELRRVEIGGELCACGATEGQAIANLNEHIDQWCHDHPRNMISNYSFQCEKVISTGPVVAEKLDTLWARVAVFIGDLFR